MDIIISPIRRAPRREHCLIETRYHPVNKTSPPSKQYSSQPKTLSNYEIGLFLENATEAALIAKHKPYIYNHQTGKGADFETDTEIIECKNHNELSYQTVPWILEHVLQRYLDSDPEHLRKWILIIPKFWYINPHVLYLLNEHSIEIVEVDIQLLDTAKSNIITRKIIKAVYSKEPDDHVLEPESNVYEPVFDSIDSSMPSVPLSSYTLLVYPEECSLQHEL